MSTTTQTNTASARRLESGKRLEGVQSTDALRRLIRDARSLGGTKSATLPETTTTTTSSLYNASPALSVEQALQVLRDYDTTDAIVPIAVLRAVEILCTDDLQRLEDCLHATQLAFTPPAPAEPESTERQKFRARMGKLKLRQEEHRYGGLVKNMGLQGPADDVTTRSMTYAASIGLNMIIAPLSFGCFMYFFAGGLFNYMGWEDTNRPAHLGPDIRKVIAGVVSGVVMLMIEMILFVIRSHEMDKATRKKAKTSKPGAFGYYTSNTERHFKGE